MHYAENSEFRFSRLKRHPKQLPVNEILANRPWRLNSPAALVITTLAIT